MGQKLTSSEIKLTYFDFRGRVEVIRYMFALKKRQFQDVRITFEEWPKLKPNTPFGTLPVLEVDGKQYGQSLAIARFAANITGLYGCNPTEQLQIDAVVDASNSIRETFWDSYFIQDESVKTEKLKALMEETIPSTLDILSKLLGKEIYFVGQKLTWADIHFFHVFETIMTTGETKTVLDKHESLKQLYQRVASTPEIAKHIENRKDTQF